MVLQILPSTVKIYAAFHTACDRYSGNDRYSGIKSPDRFFHYSGRWLYYCINVSVFPFQMTLSVWMHRIPSLRIYCTYGLKIKAQKMQIKAFLQIKSIPKSPQRSQSSLIPRFQRRCSLLNLPLIPFQTRMLHFSPIFLKPQMKISMSYFHIKKVLSFRSRCN